jgi:hypothetical protein
MLARVCFLVSCLSTLTAGQALAVEVYFNGTRVTGLKNQSFSGCAVQFDKAGNIHITAKGYTVKRLDKGTPKPASRPPTTTPPSNAGVKKYFLYSRASRPGYAQYDIDVYINGKWLRKVRNTDSQIVVEISKKLRKGRNVVHFAATKNYGGKSRLSKQASDYVQVFVGIGNRGGGTVNITSTLASFKATASTTANFGKEHTVTVN